MANMDFVVNWREIVEQAMKPDMRDLADDCQTFIDSPDGAPVITGALREASFAEYDDNENSVILGVDSTIINPRTGQEVGDYADFVIQGTENRDGNDYFERSIRAGLDVLEAKQRL